MGEVATPTLDALWRLRMLVVFAYPARWVTLAPSRDAAAETEAGK